ncbi:MAG: MATE family efflux transporter [Clostridia bacterium]|nr:MATE family efflux transporter [Clostridia bacterium]
MLLTRDREFYRRLAALAVPVALQNLMTFAVGFAGNLMVGRLGDAAVSGVYVGNQVQTLLQFFSGGIEGTLLILASRRWGGRDMDGVRRVSAAALLLTLSFAGLLTATCAIFPGWVAGLFARDAEVAAAGSGYLRIACFSYLFFCANQALTAALRSVEKARVGMVVSGLSLAVNVGLSYLLIFGRLGFPRLDVAGAAIAALVTRIFELSATAFYLLRFDKRLKLQPRSLLYPGMECFRQFIRCGAPITGGQLIWSANMLFSSAILGRFDASVIAAASVANSMSGLAYVAMNGASTAVGVITGKTVGAGDLEKVKEYARTVQLLFILLGFATAALVLLIRRPFISLFLNITPDAAGHAARFIAVLAITMIGTCYQQAGFTGLVKAGGDVGFVFRMDAVFVFLLVLPAALIARRLGAAPWIVYACLKCDQILKCPVASVKINRFNWIRPLHEP